MVKETIVLLVIDTLREDYAGPIESVLRRHGFNRVRNTIAPASWTIPSHASMFTGVYPLLHGAHEKRDRKVGRIFLTKPNLLARKLKQLGYTTYLLTANPLVTPRYGFRDFDEVFEVDYMVKEPPPLLSGRDLELVRRVRLETGAHGLGLLLRVVGRGGFATAIKMAADAIVKRVYWAYYSSVKKWPLEKGSAKLLAKLKEVLERDRGEKFIFINMMEVHDPHFAGDNQTRALVESLVRGRVGEDYVARIRRGYRRQVAYAAKRVERLVELLRASSVFENSLVIVTSDHGQMLGEYGRVHHGNFLYEELLRVPFFIKAPSKRLSASNACNPREYFSLVKVKQLVLDYAEAERLTLDGYCEPVVFAENYGIAQDIKQYVDEETWNAIAEVYEKYRIAVYYRGFKGVYNVAEWEFEEITPVNGTSTNTHKYDLEDVRESMRREVVRFIKSNTLLSRIRR